MVGLAPPRPPFGFHRKSSPPRVRSTAVEEYTSRLGRGVIFSPPLSRASQISLSERIMRKPLGVQENRLALPRDGVRRTLIRAAVQSRRLLFWGHGGRCRRSRRIS